MWVGLYLFTFYLIHTDPHMPAYTKMERQLGWVEFFFEFFYFILLLVLLSNLIKGEKKDVLLFMFSNKSFNIFLQKYFLIFFFQTHFLFIFSQVLSPQSRKVSFSFQDLKQRYKKKKTETERKKSKTFVTTFSILKPFFFGVETWNKYKKTKQYFILANKSERFFEKSF